MYIKTNLISYIRKYGKYDFENKPFNEVDNVIFSHLGYFDFQKFSLNGKTLKISQLAAMIKDVKEDMDIREVEMFRMETPKMIKAMAKTRRYKDLLIHDFQRVDAKDDPLQFSAFIVDIDKTVS